MRHFFFTLLIISLMSFSSQATVFNCSTTQEIITALGAVQAGDEIVIASGTYISSAFLNAAYFYSGADGTASNPITIRSASASNKAHLQGNNIASGTVLRIEGDYWIVQDLELSIGQKALVFDNSNYSEAINCDIHNTGNEAVHVRDGSDHVTINGCTIYNTGNVNPGYGEGIYIGTDKGSWDSYDRYCDYTSVINCTLGPNVRAEVLDIKEGTQETTIENNIIDGMGISGENFSDSFIDLKGTRTYVRYNTFNRNGAAIDKGIAVINRSVELSSYEHAIHDNVFNMDAADYNMVEAYAGTSEIYAWNNTRNPSGDDYNSRVIESCPSWYSLCGGNQTPVASITSPQNSDSFTSGDDITISANASDSDGTISSVQFFQGATLIGEDFSSPYAVTWTNVIAGNYSLTVVATDNENATTTSSQVSITVNDPTASPQLSIEYYASDTDPVNNKIRPYMKIVNSDAGSVPYEDLKIRYWFTKEEAAAMIFQCDFADIGSANVSGTFTELTPSTTGADYYLEVSFGSAAGSLGANTNSGQIKLRITSSDFSNFDEIDDYSYDAAISTYALNDKITLYQNGSLVWGEEPVSTSSGNDLSLQYYASDSDPNNNKIRPYLKIINNDLIDVPYEDLKIRYWFTKDVTSTLQFQCDYANLGTSSVNGSFQQVSGLGDNADHYLEISFDATAGDLVANDDSGNIKLRITNSTNDNFDESNDYSSDSNISSYTLYNQIALYQNDVLVWGSEPQSVIAREENTITSITIDPEISIFPNPIANSMTIRSDYNWTNGNIEIMNLLGQTVYTHDLANMQTDFIIDTSSFLSGYYLMVLKIENQVLTKKIFKQ